MYKFKKDVFTHLHDFHHDDFLKNAMMALFQFHTR